MAVTAATAMVAGAAVIASTDSTPGRCTTAPPPAAVVQEVAGAAASPYPPGFPDADIGAPSPAASAAPPDAPYGTYVHTQQWRRSAAASRCVLAFDVRRWSTPTQGRVETVALPPQSGGQRRAQYLAGPPPGSTPTVVEYPPEVDGWLAAVASSDPVVLAAQLAHTPMSDQLAGSHAPGLRITGDQRQHMLHRVVGLYERQLLDPVQRGALMSVLAGIHGPRWRGRTVDRAGRPGNAISLDTVQPGGTALRDLLIITDDGVLLSHEQELPVKGSPPTVIGYTVILSVRRLATGSRPTHATDHQAQLPLTAGVRQPQTAGWATAGRATAGRAMAGRAMAGRW